MKRLISAVAVLTFLTVAAPAFALDADPQAQRTTGTLIDEVIRMSQAGVDDATIIAYVQKTRDRFDVTADDLIALTGAKVAKSVIRAVVDEADNRNGDRDRGVRRTVVEPRVYVGSPWFWSPYYYDPYWYGPRFNVSLGFGGFWGGHHRYRGGFHHGGSRGHHRGRR